MESTADIHDPGLTPGGKLNATEFCRVYPFLRNPQVIVASHLRRSLQTACCIAEALQSSGKAAKGVCIIANPDFQEVSLELCNTGTPLDVLCEEFPSIEFRPDLFPDDYPRLRHVRVEKKAEFSDEPHLLAERAERARKFLREDLVEKEIIVITHGSFAHYLFNYWSGDPGKSYSALFPLGRGRVQPSIMPEAPSSEDKLIPFLRYAGPFYSRRGELQDFEPDVYASGERDCGIFTDAKIRDAVGSP